MIKCPNPDCGYENVDGTQFCEGCGEELPQTAGAAPTPTPGTMADAASGNMVKCPACDNLNPPDNVVCEVCGTELQPGAAPAGTGAATPGTATTGSAGTAADTGASGITPDAAMAPPVAGIVDTPPGSTADNTDAGDAGLLTVPATPAPAGAGTASPPADVSQPAVDVTAGPGIPTPGIDTAAMTAPTAGVDALTPGTAPVGPPPADSASADVTAPVDVPPSPATPAFPATPGNLEPGRVKLVVEQGMTVGAQFVLGDPEILVGREDEDESIYPDIDLSDQDAGYVHRRHATIKFENGNLSVTHLGGMNKTRVNNRPLPDNEPQPLKLGDKVAFGKVVLRVQPN